MSSDWNVKPQKRIQNMYKKSVQTRYILVHTGMYHICNCIPVHTSTYWYILVCTQTPDFVPLVGIPDVDIASHTIQYPRYMILSSWNVNIKVQIIDWWYIVSNIQVKHHDLQYWRFLHDWISSQTFDIEDTGWCWQCLVVWGHCKTLPVWKKTLRLPFWLRKILSRGNWLSK
jgi:hypothetical protein